MKYIVIFILIIVHIYAGVELGYGPSSPLWTHLTYQFQHTGWAHLIVNSITFVSFFDVLKKAFSEYQIILYGYIGSVLASFPIVYEVPTVGASGIVYTLAGLFISTSLIGSKLHIINTRKFTAFILCVFISFIFSWLKGGINIVCHILSLVYGIIIGLIDNELSYEGY